MKATEKKPKKSHAHSTAPEEPTEYFVCSEKKRKRQPWETTKGAPIIIPHCSGTCQYLPLPAEDFCPPHTRNRRKSFPN
jgi:hypothetical protein